MFGNGEIQDRCAPLHLSPVGRGRFRLRRNRVRGHSQIEPSSCRIVSSTPSMFAYTSSLVTRTTWKPSDSSMRVRSASRRTSCGSECVAPSTSMMSLPSSVTKSTKKRSIGCCRRNFQRPNWRPRSFRQSSSSALVCSRRSSRARLLKRSIPLTRPLARPTSPHRGEV